jgi:ribosomal protein L11 methylase PrmA
VAANLNSDLCQKAAPRLWPVIRLSGRLIISGLMRNQVEPITEKLHELRGRIEATRARGKWVTMLVEKTS